MINETLIDVKLKFVLIQTIFNVVDPQLRIVSETIEDGFSDLLDNTMIDVDQETQE
jgi:hypothetical protein